MRIPFPERVGYSHALIFAGLLGAVQLLEHSNPVMVGLVFCFILVSTAAFNIAGGMYYPSGAFIGSNAVMTLLLPMVAKALLGQPADRNLRVPVKTVEIYLCGMMVMFLAALITRQFRPSKTILSDKLPAQDMRAAYRGCVVFSYMIVVFIAIVAASGDGGGGSLQSFINQIDKFPILAYILGVVSTIRFTQGRRSLSYPLLALMLYGASSGLLSFSKEAFLAPFFCWALTAAYMRYRVSWLNVACFAAGMYLTVTYIVPYSQIGKGELNHERSPQQISAYMLTHMDEVRASYKEQNVDFTDYIRDYDRPISLLDRLDVLAIDDALIDTTDRAGFFGYQPILSSFYNVVPHFLWPSKPRVFFGNLYAHEIGILGKEDYTTGISFSYASDAYHQGGVICIFLICPFLFAMSFAVMDSVIGDTRRNPVGLLLTVVIFRFASEGGLAGVINLVEQPLVATIIVAMAATYLLPVIGRVFIRSGEVPEPITSQPIPVPHP